MTPLRTPPDADANVLCVVAATWGLRVAVTGGGAAQALVACLDATRPADGSSGACTAPPSNPCPTPPPRDA